MSTLFWEQLVVWAAQLDVDPKVLAIQLGAGASVFATGAALLWRNARRRKCNARRKKWAEGHGGVTVAPSLVGGLSMATNRGYDARKPSWLSRLKRRLVQGAVVGGLAVTGRVALPLISNILGNQNDDFVLDLGDEYELRGIVGFIYLNGDRNRLFRGVDIYVRDSIQTGTSLAAQIGYDIAELNRDQPHYREAFGIYLTNGIKVLGRKPEVVVVCEYLYEVAGHLPKALEGLLVCAYSEDRELSGETERQNPKYRFKRGPDGRVVSHCRKGEPGCR